MASLSTLVVDLQVESAKLRSGLGQANKHLEGFGAQAKRIGNLVAGAFAANITKDAIVGLANFVRQGAQVADEMGEMAASIGVPVESFSQLAHAAEFSNLSTEQLGAGMGKLAKLMGEAATGGRDQAALFKALGVSVTDSTGKMRGTDEVLKDLAEQFAGMESGTAKATLAQKLFGESGVKMLPLLDQGREGLAEMAAEADRFGTTVTEKGSASAAVFNDSLDRVRKMASGLAIRVAQDLAPSVANLSEHLLGGAKKSNLLNDAAKILAGTFRVLVSAGTIVGAVFDWMGTTIAGVASAVVNAAQGDFAAAKESLKATGQSLDETLKSTQQSLKDIWSTDTGAAEALDNQGKAAEKSADAIVRAIQKQKELSDLRTKAANEATAALRKMQAEAERIEASVRTPMESFRAELRALNDLVEKGAISWETYNRARNKANEKLNSAIGLPETTNREGDVNTVSTVAPGSGADVGTLKSQAKVLKADAAAERSLMDSFDAAAKNIGKAMGAAAMRFASKLGDAGQVAGSFMEGLQTGGIWGAFIAAIMELFSMFEGFQSLVDIVNGSLKSHIEVLSSAFGALVEGLAPLLGAVSFLIDVVLGLLTPIIESLAGVFEAITPIIYLVGMLLVGLQPVFDMLGKVIEGVIWVLEKVLRHVFEVLKGVGVIILGIAYGLAWAWNKILQFVTWVLQEVVKIVEVATRGLVDIGGLREMADGMGSAAIDLNSLSESMKNLNDMTWESAMAASKKTAEDLKAAEAANKLNEALTNVPSGIKVAALRFNASDPVGGAALAGGGGGLVGQLGGTVTNTYVFNIDSKARSGAELGEEMMRYLKKKKFARTGTPYGPLGG